MTLRFGTTVEQDLFNITGRKNFLWKLLLVLRCNARALLEIRDELRCLNEGRDQFNAAMLEFFERLTEDPQPGPDGSLRSEQPAAAPDGQEEWDPCECGGGCGDPKEERR